MLVIVSIVTPLVVVTCILKRNKSVDLNDDDVAHCSVNPSYDTVHSTTTNKHNIVYDEVHTTPSCTYTKYMTYCMWLIEIQIVRQLVYVPS